ncbi:MAG: PDZ domain-containing protein [Deltaproteobacteria bacterium]|nr:PDZ domain-containing protein [Deltaproteobacteria bacterium]
MPVSRLSRLLKPLLVICAVSVAYCITFVWPEDNGIDFDIDSSARVKAARDRAPYDLSQVRVLKTVVTKVNDNYVEPDRIVHQKMLMAGLNAIQRTVAPVLIEYKNGDSEFTVQVNNKKKVFQAKDVNSPWTLSWRFQEIFSFLQKNLKDEEVKFQDIEYNAVNGMLRTLDPHSVLLTPEQYSEMQLNTLGEFGGLGIVISIRDGQLTVIKPMADTPASRAGLKAGDRVVKINDESTMNMPLEEAVKRLRGAPGSSVTVWIVREGARGWVKPRRFDVVRAVIHIEAIEARMLSDAIGSIRVKSFHSSTCDDIRRELKEMHRKNMRGLVLDLRDNPGGLLQQAVCMADMFLSSGTIVTTSSNDPQEDERKLATAEGTEPNYPMVVLVNGGSASASEIVAGALKSHDRALVIGQQTFGKGSVQMLYNDERDGWALKLTVAQYLTPGDVSIQGIGIIPDIAIDPMTVDRLDMDLTIDKEYLRESDLAAHLTHDRAREYGGSEVVLRYYLPQETRQKLREAQPEEIEENVHESEFLTRFSKELLERASRPGRPEMLEDAKPVIDAARTEEMKRAEKELSKLGVNWKVGADQGASEVSVQVSTNQKNNRVRAGEPFELEVELTNKGKAPLYQLRGLTKSDNLLFNERELVFGLLEPGKSRKWTTTLGLCRTEEKERTCIVPRSMPDRADGIRVEFSEAYDHAPKTVEIRTAIESLPRPQFAYLLQMADTSRGNGDGELQLGEHVTLYLTLENVGVGKSYRTLASLRNLSGRGILLVDGRFNLDEMQPNTEKTVAFTFEVLPDFDQEEAKLELAVLDTELSQPAGETLRIPIQKGAKQTIAPRSDNVIVKSGARLLERPRKEGRVVARAQNGAVAVPATAAAEEFVRVSWGDGRPGWVAKGDLLPSGTGANGEIVAYLDRMPPRLEIDYGNQLVTRDPQFRLRGSASDNQRIRDIYIFVGARKVFYRSNRDSANPKKVDFEAEIPLREGINYISVVARENNDIATRKTFVVRRDAPDGSLLETPKTDEELFFELGE